MEQLPAYYTHLFNAVTDALIALNQFNIGQAKELLISAQQTAEALWISQNESE